MGIAVSGGAGVPRAPVPSPGSPGPGSRRPGCGIPRDVVPMVAGVDGWDLPSRTLRGIELMEVAA